MRPDKAAFVTGTGSATTADALTVILAVPAWMGVACLVGAGRRGRSTSPAAVTLEAATAAQAVVLSLPLIAVLTQAASPLASARAGLGGLAILAAGWWRHSRRWPVPDDPSLSLPAAAAAAAALTRRFQRAGTLLVVAAAIAAVDFAAFPRAWAKDAACDAGGLALMDSGLGLLVALNGAARLGASADPPRFVRDVAPCLAIGLARAVLLPLLGYHAVPHEAGAHCNAFLVLAALRLTGRWGVALPARLAGWAVPPGPPDGGGLARAAGGVAAVHGAALAAGLKAWALSARGGEADPAPPSVAFRRLVALAVANKESLAAFPGLWALHAGAAAVARWHATAEEEEATAMRGRGRSPRRWPPRCAGAALASAAGRRTVRSGAAAAACAVAATALARLDPPCRRCANPSYVLLCLALHEATAAATAAVLAVVVWSAGSGAAARAAPLLTSGLGGAGALPALLVANLGTGTLNLLGLPDGAGPGRARALLMAHLGLTLAASGAAARWRAAAAGRAKAVR